MFSDITERTQPIASTLCLVQHATRFSETDRNVRRKTKAGPATFPKPINVDLYYAEEQTIIDPLNIQLESITAKVADLEDEHGGEEGVLAELATR
jgi:type I restriction enzyme M protein